MSASVEVAADRHLHHELVLLTAGLSLAAAAIHTAASVDHFSEYVLYAAYCLLVASLISLVAAAHEHGG